MNDILPPRRLPTPQVPNRPINSGGRPVVPVPQRPLSPSKPHPQQPVTLPPVAPIGIPAPEPPKRKRLKKWLIVCAVFIVLIAGAVWGGYFWYTDSLKPLSASNDAIKIEVQEGSVADSVASELEQKKVIKSGLALQLYMKFQGNSHIKAGNYAFKPSQSPQEIMQWLNEGKVDTYKITILPGKTLAELRKIFLEYGYSADQIDTAFAQPYAHSLLSDKPANTTLEGYLYPDTYYVEPNTSLEDLITQSFDLFQKRIDTNNLKQKLVDRGFSLYQAITLASIVGKEVSNPEEQRHVAQVFELRLKKDMELGSDPTYKYAASLLGVKPAVDLDSPYNTRIKKGLPPGPISNFTLDALKAVANPADTDHLYFVSGDDGITRFSHTEEQHKQDIEKYCHELCAKP